MCCLYQISEPDGTVILTDWSHSTSDPLSAIVAVDEGRAFAERVAAGELSVTVLVGGLMRNGAVAAVRLLNPLRRGAGRVSVAAVVNGAVVRFPTIRAAAASLNISRVDLERSLHRIGNVGVYCVPDYPGRKKGRKAILRRPKKKPDPSIKLLNNLKKIGKRLCRSAPVVPALPAVSALLTNYTTGGVLTERNNLRAT
jgi:hypothetical protein